METELLLSLYLTHSSLYSCGADQIMNGGKSFFIPLFFDLFMIQIDRYYASKASLFIFGINRFRITFFGYFKLHENDASRIVEGGGGERDDNRRHKETEEQKATSFELERWCKHYYSPFLLLMLLTVLFFKIGAENKEAYSP